MWCGTGVSFLSFCMHSVCASVAICLLVIFSVVCLLKNSIMSKLQSKERFGWAGSIQLWVPPCPFYILGGGTHSLCVVCLGARHIESALVIADGLQKKLWVLFLLPLFLPQRALFEEGDFTSISCCAGPSFAETKQRLFLWVSQIDPGRGKVDGRLVS